MQIKPNKSQQITNDLQSQKLAESQKTNELNSKKGLDKSVVAGKGKHYDVALSSHSKQLKADHQNAFKIAKDTRSINEEKVAALKAQIAAGDYKVDSGKIADGILKEAIREHLSISE